MRNNLKLQTFTHAGPWQKQMATCNHITDSLWFLLVSVVLQASLSLPGSPFMRRGSKASQFSWSVRKGKPPRGDRQPLVLPYLDNLNLPYADDSNAVTPTSDELCNSQNTQSFLVGRRRLSSTSYNSRISHPSYAIEGSGKFVPGSRRGSYASHHSKHSHMDNTSGFSSKKDRNREPTHFHWNASVKRPAAHPLLPEVIVDKTKSDDNVSPQDSLLLKCISISW